MMATKRHKEADRKQAKHQELAEAENLTNIPITCTPSNHSFYNAPSNTISHTIIKYLTNLEENDVIARPAIGLVFFMIILSDKRIICLYLLQKSQNLHQKTILGII